MATGNFKTMANFPLIVAMPAYTKVCPECGLGQDNENEKCEDCGCDLTKVEATVDEFYLQDMCENMKKVAEHLNEVQDFYEVTVEDGYYQGIQFYVTDKYEGLADWDAEDVMCEFGLRRRIALRRYNAACKRIQNELIKAKNELGLKHFGVYARFSNGECWYNEVA